MIIDFAVAFIMVVVAFLIWSNWNDEKINLKSVRIWFYIIITSLLTLTNYFLFDNLYKFVNLTICFIIIYKLFYKTSIKKSIICPVLLQTIFFISECIFASIMIIILKNGVNEFVNNYFGEFITNFCVTLLAFIISRLKLVKKIYNTINSMLSKTNETNIMFLSIFILYIYSIFSFNVYYGNKPEELMIISGCISVLSLILFFSYVKSRSDYYDINDKYNNSLLSLKELEKVLVNHRIDNHENKNHLMTIRNMTKNKKLTGFIDSILNNKIDDDKRIMHETSIIPAGGLRGLIYSKLLLMNSKNIEYELDVSSSVRVVNMLEYDDVTMLNICKIVGIFLDNAIEEMDNVDDKYIIIELYNEDSIFKISITNTYDNKVDKNNINKPGVTTKDGNHGYGLSLVKKLTHNNDNLKTITEITEEEFTQTLEIIK